MAKVICGGTDLIFPITDSSHVVSAPPRIISQVHQTRPDQTDNQSIRGRVISLKTHNDWLSVLYWSNGLLIGYSFSLIIQSLPFYSPVCLALDDVHFDGTSRNDFISDIHSQSIEQGIHNWRDVTQVNNVLRLLEFSTISFQSRSLVLLLLPPPALQIRFVLPYLLSTSLLPLFCPSASTS